MEHSEKRRSFLRGLLVSTPTLALAGSSALSGMPTGAEAASASAAATASYKPVFFTAEEWKFVVQACDVIIPADEFGPSASAANVPVFIDRQLNGDFGRAASWYMKGPFEPSAAADRGYQLSLTPAEVYRLGIKEMERLAQATYQLSFDQLSVEHAEEFLEHVEAAKIKSPDVDLKTFVSFLIQNTKEGYFADPIHGGNKDMQSWKMIGYPGARASFLEWVDQYNKPYPLGPVSINGEQG